MHRASDEVENEEWLQALDEAADRLELSSEARSNASDVFLTTLPDSERSKQARVAAALYVGALLASEERSQTAVAEAVDVSRLAVQQHWKDLLSAAGFDPPGW